MPSTRPPTCEAQRYHSSLPDANDLGGSSHDTREDGRVIALYAVGANGRRRTCTQALPIGPHKSDPPA